MIYKETIKEMLKECLVFDIETSSIDSTGKEINIKTDFENYLKYAVVKWVGFYSYKYKKYYNYNCIENRSEIIELFNSHNVLIGINNINFDFPICVNNGLISDKKNKINLDVQIILGNDSLRFHKNRALFMGVKLKPVVENGKEYGPNSLMGLAKNFNLETIKGDISYETFLKTSWNEQETKDIIKYLSADVTVTKLLFDKLLNFWAIFTDWLYIEDVKNWSWINKSIAGLTYLASCKVKNVKPTYGKAGEKESMGGRCIEPLQEESFGIHYLDEASKYPHIFAQFNLFNEVDISTIDPHILQKEIECGNIFHENKLFKTKGYYEISKQGVLEKDVLHKLKTRIAVKKVLKNINKNNYLEIEIPEELKEFIKDKQLSEYNIISLNGLQYAIKIFLNSLYGAVRSAIFKQIHTLNAGYDCCWIGQQIHEYVEKFFKEKGYITIGGFTDSWFILEKEGDTKESIKKLCEEAMNEIKKYFPFPADTHIIDYECYMDYILYNKNEKTNEYKKNNYAYISNNKIKIVGFPIMKNNASKLSIHIFNKYLKPEGLKNKRLKFKEKYIKEIIAKELTDDINLASVNFKCNNADTYKNRNQIQAQISRVYFDGLDGSIDVIKNFKTGSVGKTSKYCTVEEAKKSKLNINDLDLTKVWNELEPFIEKEKPLDLFSFGNNDKEKPKERMGLSKWC